MKAIHKFRKIRDSARIFYASLRPRYIFKYLPSNPDDIDSDIDRSDSDYAYKNFPDRGGLYRRLFGDAEARELAPADIVMMNGGMHNIPDDALSSILDGVRGMLAPGGLLSTLDGCYVQGQSKFRKWLLDQDRGRYVRSLADYEKVVRKSFAKVDLNIREAYSRVPYEFLIGLASNDPIS